MQLFPCHPSGHPSACQVGEALVVSGVSGRDAAWFIDSRQISSSLHLYAYIIYMQPFCGDIKT